MHEKKKYGAALPGMGRGESYRDRHRRVLHVREVEPQGSPADELVRLVDEGYPTPDACPRTETRIIRMFEAAMGVFVGRGWDDIGVWRAATEMTLVEAPTMATASILVSMVNEADAQALMANGMRPKYRGRLWVMGRVTDLGASYDAAFPGLNVHNWQSRLRQSNAGGK